MRSILLLTACGACVSSVSADITPQLAPRGTMAEQHVAHIYYNFATGEKVATLIDAAVRPADSGSSDEVWVSNERRPCEQYSPYGFLSAGIMDSPYCTTCMPSTATGMIYLDWGDIEPDTVVDCVGVNWVTCTPDPDLDGDGVGDGIEGFAGTWMFYDAENGFDSSEDRAVVSGFTLVNLPGRTVGSAGSRYNCSSFTATVDLSSSFSSSLVFEIADTDLVDGSGTGAFNPGAGVDLDSDGLMDFGYSLGFIQPGTYDFDNADGDDDPTTGVDGDPDIWEETGWGLGMPPGEPIDLGNGEWAWQPDGSPAGQGAEDAFDILFDSNADGVYEPFGTFWFGGFSCDRNQDGVPDDVRASAQFYIELYGPSGTNCCPADVFPASPPGQPVCASGDGLLNFFDVSAFVSMFSAGDDRADIAPPIGQLNFFDVSQFMTNFIAGCP